MPKLLFLGGPPGIGKTTVAPLLAAALEPCAWVDADDLWRIHPFAMTDAAKQMVESNIVHVLGGFLRAGYPRVFMTWVLHRSDLIERLLEPLQVEAAQVVHLTAEPACLRARLASRPEQPSASRALERLAQIQALPYAKLDTTELSPLQVAAELQRIWIG